MVRLEYMLEFSISFDFLVAFSAANLGFRGLWFSFLVLSNFFCFCFGRKLNVSSANLVKPQSFLLFSEAGMLNCAFNDFNFGLVCFVKAVQLKYELDILLGFLFFL